VLTKDLVTPIVAVAIGTISSVNVGAYAQVVAADGSQDAVALPMGLLVYKSHVSACK